MHVTRLPSIHNNAPVTGQSPRMSFNAQLFAVAWMRALGERALLMVLDDRLTTAAMLHAVYLDSRTEQEIAERDHIPHASHYGRDWSTANERVRAQGYMMPSNYPLVGNHVESNARDGGTPEVVLAGLLASEAHGPHLRGEPGFEDRTVYGIGNCQSDWVVLACPPEAIE